MLVALGTAAVTAFWVLQIWQPVAWANTEPLARKERLQMNIITANGHTGRLGVTAAMRLLATASNALAGIGTWNKL